MSLQKENVQKIAHLARLNLQGETLDHMTAELNKIMDWIEALSNIDTEGVEPLRNVTKTHLDLRQDVVKRDVVRDDILANAKDAVQGFFSVPKVVD